MAVAPAEFPIPGGSFLGCSDLIGKLRYPVGFDWANAASGAGFLQPACAVRLWLLSSAPSSAMASPNEKATASAEVDVAISAAGGFGAPEPQNPTMTLARGARRRTRRTR